jgi:hypothetical protein
MGTRSLLPSELAYVIPTRSNALPTKLLPPLSRRGDLDITSVTSLRLRTPFVGREAELRALDDLLRGEARVVHLHGIAGIGKSVLVRAFIEHAEQASAMVLELDCRSIEPTVRGLQEAIVGSEDSETLVDYFERLVPPVVLVLDHYELFRLMDTWLRQVLLPKLPSGVSLLLAGRVAGWFPCQVSAACRSGFFMLIDRCSSPSRRVN